MDNASFVDQKGVVILHINPKWYSFCFLLFLSMLFFSSHFLFYNYCTTYEFVPIFGKYNIFLSTYQIQCHLFRKQCKIPLALVILHINLNCYSFCFLLFVSLLFITGCSIGIFCTSRSEWLIFWCARCRELHRKYFPLVLVVVYSVVTGCAE